MRSSRILATMLVVAVASGRLAQAGGPLVYADDGSIVKWPTTGGRINVVLRLDQGGLGTLNNSQANALVANVISVWNNVSQSTVNLTISPTPLSQDVTSASYQMFLGSSTIHGFNPVIYDVDGQIVDLYFGGNRGNTVLGYANSLFYVDADGHPAPGDFVEGQMVLNGRFLDGNSLSPNDEVAPSEFEGVIVHELGHMLGLDHSQINVTDPTNDSQPTMFPYFQKGTIGMRTLKIDDIGWVSYLYPSAQYSTSFGSISGQVVERVLATDHGFQGINVIARRVGGGRIEAVSCVSGYVYRAGYGSLDRAGRYFLPGVPSGDYTVEIERIYQGFTNGSSVGPLDPPVGFPGIAGAEYYNGARESAFDNKLERTNVAVATGNETTEINIVLNTQTPVADVTRWLLYR